MFAYDRFFSFPLNNGNQHARYTFENYNYATMMTNIMKNLDAIRLNKGFTIFSELDEVREIYFFSTGTVEIGFEINRVPNICIWLKHTAKYGHTIGGYGCTFDKRSFFLVRTSTVCEGFFIRKHFWREAIEEFPTLEQEIRKQIKMNYIKDIETKVLKEKKK